MVQFASYLRNVLCKTRLIFPRINGPNMVYYLVYLRSYSNLTTQRITNFFEKLQDLINIIKFPQDLVVDITLDGEKWTIKLNSRMKLSFPFI